MKKNNQVTTHELAELVTEMGSTKKTLMLLTLFLTESELQSVTKRLQIFKLLAENTQYGEIQNSLGVSSATVSSVAQLLKHPFSTEVLRHLAARDWATRTARSLREWFSPLLS